MNPNPDRDERVSATPERIWIDPDEQTPELQFFFENSTEGFIEYVRADNAATRMRDRCVEKVREIPMPTHLSESGEEIVTHFRARVIRYLESLTLEGEQEK